MSVTSSPKRILLMKMADCFWGEFMWKVSFFFVITTKEQPQEGRVETVNCLMDGGCVFVLRSKYE